MYRSFTARGSHRWVDILQDLIDGYNNSKHRSLGGVRPVDVKKSNENLIRKILFPKIKKKKQHTKAIYKIGDTVRIAMKRRPFQKAYLQNFSYEVFEVSSVKNTYPTTYTLRDFQGEPVQGSFYKGEIQLVDKSDGIYPINKIVKTRKRRGITEYLVNFLGYPEDFTEWIPQELLFDGS